MPAGYVPEIPADFVKSPQYIEETTLGTTPTASPTFLEIGKINRWQPTHDTNNRKFRVLGSEDLLTAVKTGEAWAIQCEYHPFSSTFLKYLTQARGGGAGSIDKTLSILWSQKINAVESYEIASMCRINTGTITITPDEVKVACTIIAGAISAPSGTSGLTTPNFVSPSGSAPWVGIDSGANPFTWNAVSYDVPQIRIDFTRNLHLLRVNGQIQIIDNPATRREIKGSIDVVRKDSVLKADARALTQRSASYVLKSAVSTLSLTNAMLEKLSESYDGESGNTIIDTYALFAQAASLS